MKKFKMSLAATATVLAIAGCGDTEEGNNGGGNETNQNNGQTEEVNEEPDVNMADNNENNDELDTDNDAGLNDDNNAANNMEEDGEEAEAVMDQDFQNFDLNVTLVDDTEWEFNYNPAQEDGEEPEATISGDDINLEGEEAVEEMESYLSEFHVNAASEQEEITSEIADTFDFNEDDFQEYTLTIDFAEQENETEWTWSQDQDGENEGGEEDTEGGEEDAGSNDDGLNFEDNDNSNQ
ncbi:YusW family protein [Salipaludibacillus aurantiacus]|uniref:YusW-like protein n=1 Tax=Salipaludibacillus aurantiacus TaxID=1601833 RepID=A0A1H9S6N9_9BACI|nr:YusW family protein [Salipaludibacillus aurantiacus]SER80640.1 YusW-like protein [Salipaludibacillus aurantiacus]